MRISYWSSYVCSSDLDYLSLAYALAGTVDNFLIEYFVYRNPVLRQALRAEEDIARFLSTLWYRALYLDNPPDAFLGPLAGFKQVRLPATPAARRSAAKSKPHPPAGAARRPSRTCLIPAWPPLGNRLRPPEEQA